MNWHGATDADAAACAVVDCPTLVVPGRRFCSVHLTAQPAPHNGTCAKCHKPYRGGAPFRARDLVIRHMDAVRLEDMYVHAICPTTQRRDKSK